ncbi:Uma2 family endonuclease [Actinomadura barringtoniae]|uniref:Uma2 family endonuclease n=1 Tax=Actinomadura barringtoniae TaxID=1427535 RepID=A0A939PB83_9ACTN|nr:Uma2 family endonuclease [Actinomadura barringtoniae]MBO2446838.1 Uma2 family endonuclease [Actinomadura barringtoniae]
MPEPDQPSPVPRWLIPPEGGFTADDLDNLPQLPPHAELIDGSLVLVSPQAIFHMLVISLLETTLRQLAPANLRVRREITITLGKRQRPEPDVLILRAADNENLTQTSYRPEDVVLAVEVVSPDSEERDRKRKPALYAEAGIRHFWRVENTGGRPTVYVYELDPATRSYALTGIHHERLKLSVPFDIDIDLTAIDRL